MMSWAEAELAGLRLGDRRRERRAVRVLERLGERPTASIPGACRGWAEIQAAYRFLAHEGYDWLDLLEPHRLCTQRRMAEQPVVLCLQDTTELDFNGQAISGLGPLSYEAQRGMYLHPTLAVTPGREPLGILDAWMWAREPKGTDGTRPGAKESERWLEGYARVAELAAHLPETRLVYVADREADILALMVRAERLGAPADWLVRAQHNRVLPEGARLWEALGASAPLGEIRFTAPRGKGRRARAVRQALRIQRLGIPDSAGGEIQVTALMASEIDPPPGVTPITWRLLTNREATTLEAARELIDWYRARWEIELLFLVLKEGCRVEALQLASRERLERALALYLIIAWRVTRLMRLGRTVPDLPADLLFEPEEWQAAYILAKQPPPEKPPRLNEVIRLIARHGGFLARKGDGEPGAKSLWLGLQRVQDVAVGLKYASQYQRL